MRRAGPRPLAAARADRALVLRRFPYGESSLLVHLLTPRHGRVVVLAKGAYRPTSGYCGVLDLFDELEVGWRQGERSEVGVLQRASVEVRRRGITRELARYEVACAALELTALACRDGHAEPELYAHLTTTLQALHAGLAAPRLLGLAFELGVLRRLGLEPALERCAACGRDLGGERRREAPFAPGAGGRLCDPCADDARRSGRAVGTLPRPVLRVARSLLDAPVPSLGRVHLDAELLRDLERFVHRFVEYHLESRLRARGAASRLVRAAPMGGPPSPTRPRRVSPR